jgi:hypothetical protein
VETFLNEIMGPLKHTIWTPMNPSNAKIPAQATPVNKVFFVSSLSTGGRLTMGYFEL